VTFTRRMLCVAFTTRTLICVLLTGASSRRMSSSTLVAVSNPSMTRTQPPMVGWLLVLLLDLDLLKFIWSLQCFDTVGWASGRASAVYKLSDEVLVWLSVWIKVHIICIWSSWCYCHHKTPSSLASFKSTLFLPCWYGLTRVSCKKRPLNGCSSSSYFVVKKKLLC